MDFAFLAGHSLKLKESEKKDKYIDLTRELKKLWNMKVAFIPFVIGVLGTVTKGLVKGLEDLEITEWLETIQTTLIVKIGQNIAKSPGELRKFAVTQTSVKDHQR